MLLNKYTYSRARLLCPPSRRPWVEVRRGYTRRLDKTSCNQKMLLCLAADSEVFLQEFAAYPVPKMSAVSGELTFLWSMPVLSLTTCKKNKDEGEKTMCTSSLKQLSPKHETVSASLLVLVLESFSLPNSSKRLHCTCTYTKQYVQE